MRIVEEHPHHLLYRGEPLVHLLSCVIPERAARSSKALPPQGLQRRAVRDQLPEVRVHFQDFARDDTALAAGLPARLAAGAAEEGPIGERQAEPLQDGWRRLILFLALAANASHQPRAHHARQSLGDEEWLDHCLPQAHDGA